MNIYCSGIGGIGLSAYAALQKAAGHTVSGSDRVQSALTDSLSAQGITVHLQQDGSHIPEDCDLFVYSEAIPADAPERRRAAELGIEQQSYFQALGNLSEDYMVIAVCGTHGKSSTTSMLAKILVDAGKDPTIVVGTKVADLDGKNWRAGKSDIFVVEACEYRRSFHYLSPDIILMTNVDGDHFDAYEGIEDYQKAFIEFMERLPQGGPVIAHLGDSESRTIAEQSGKTLINADIEALPTLSIPGLHMQQNAQLAVALAKHLDIDQKDIDASLAAYKGCWRRMELKGEYEDIPVFDDYAHHPLEIQVTLSALKNQYPSKRLVCVFQPHTHDRTLKMYKEFTESFSDADLLIVPDIYEARSDIETEIVDLPRFLEDSAAASAVEVLDGVSLEKTQKMLRDSVLQSGDLLVCMGAGTITDLAEAMVS